MELTWAADETMQQFGRTHRSNQTSTPKYEMLVSSLGGEARFLGAITSRLQRLGALTKGDRGAAVGDVEGAAEFTSQTFFNTHGTLALTNMAGDLTQATPPDPLPPCVFDGKSWDAIEDTLSEALHGIDTRYSPVRVHP